LYEFKERFQAEKESAFEPQTGFAQNKLLRVGNVLLSKTGTPLKRDL